MVFKGETLQEASDCKVALDSLFGEYFKNHPELGQTENPSWDNITTEGHFLAPAVVAKESQAGEEEFDRDISSLQAASGEEVAAFLKEAGIPVSYTHLDVYKRQGVAGLVLRGTGQSLVDSLGLR